MIAESQECEMEPPWDIPITGSPPRSSDQRPEHRPVGKKDGWNQAVPCGLAHPCFPLRSGRRVRSPIHVDADLLSAAEGKRSLHNHESGVRGSVCTALTAYADRAPRLSVAESPSRFAIASMVRGEVPQQPPITVAPAAFQVTAWSA